MLRKLFWPILIILSSVFAGILVWSNSGGALRSILLFWFILICPGIAIIPLLHIKDFLSELVLVIVLSLGLSTIVAEFMVLARLWSPSAGLAALIGISLVGAALQIRTALKPDLSMR